MNQHRAELVRYRLQQASQALCAAQVLLDAGDLPGSLNRSYYGMFYAVLALLGTQGLGTSKHAGAIALFNREFIKQGVFPAEMGRHLRQTFDLRLRADYMELFEPKTPQVVDTLSHAREFVDAITRHVQPNGS